MNPRPDLCLCSRWMRLHRVNRREPRQIRDQLARDLTDHTLDGSRLKFWACFHDLKRAALRALMTDH